MLTSITITSPVNPLRLGLPKTLTAIGTYADGSTQDISLHVKWLSSDSTIADFIQITGGLLLGVKIGSAEISASLNGITSNILIVTVS